MRERTEPRRIPVLVLSGFLGSGKTTLLNCLLKLPALAGTAVIINEFGETPLDHHLVEASDDGIIELSNGCLCCTVRGQLVETLERLVGRRPPPAAILIETTGLADPLPVLQAVLSSPGLDERLAFRGLTTVFDAVDGRRMIENHREARRQLALADHVVLSKLDLEGADEHAARQTLAETGTAGCVHTAAAFSERLGENGLAGLVATPYLSRELSRGDHDHAHGDHPHHDVNRHSETLRCLTLKPGRPLRRAELDLFLDLLLSAHGDHVPRIKGLVAIKGEDRPLLIQAVYRRMSPPETLPAWPQGIALTALTVFVDGIEPSFVRDLFDGFTGRPGIDRPDRQALTDNPLSLGSVPFKPAGR
ncbi:MAG: GTP-binding protein [Nitratireductor sp.]|nr:GTP-binding protein [Nitratireductor sp.]